MGSIGGQCTMALRETVYETPLEESRLEETLSETRSNYFERWLSVFGCRARVHLSAYIM